jgi:hypothetical protein
LPTTQLKKLLASELLVALESRGFRRRTGYAFTIGLAPQIAGRFAATHDAPYPYDSIVLSPLIGVRYEPSARIVDEVLGRRRALMSPTLQKALVYLVPWLGPGDESWEFGENSASRHATLRDMLRCLDVAAIPWMRSLDTGGAILAALEADRSDIRNRYEAAVLKWTIGNREGAIEELAAIARQGRSADGGDLREYFGVAAARTLDRFGSLTHT